MKRAVCLLTCMLVVVASFGAEVDGYTVKDFSLTGAIEGENITFSLDFDVEAEKGVDLPLVVGDVAYLDGTFPKRAELAREGNRYFLRFNGDQGGFGFGKSREGHVSFEFASRPQKDGDWRQTSFAIPSSSIRKLAVTCDRDDLEVRFPGALRVTRGKSIDGRTQVTAYLGVSGKFEVAWKPEVKKLESELVVSCDANTIATASVGALRLDTVFTYRVIQGMLDKLTLLLPDVNVTQVRGDDIQDWSIDRTDPQNPKLLVSLSRPKEDLYRLQVEGEMVLPEFPCTSDLPVFTPQEVLRTSGFVMIGADSAIKLQITRVAGLTQVDQASFPAVMMDANKGRAKPTRTLYAYQYANTPYRLEVNADDIVTSFTADDHLVVSYADNELSLDASVEIEVKDAPAREITIETDNDPAWTVTSVTGQYVSEADTDIREEQGRRIIYVPFTQAVTGPTLVNVRMEKSLKADTTSFSTPAFKLRGAKSERGYLVVAAEKGVRLKPAQFSGLREVHTGSAPMRVEGAQHAFRFKSPDWSVTLDVQRSMSSVHAEAFHLVSLGEGVMYCSATINYDIDGSPLQEFKVHVPAEIETVEFVGADIEGWTREDEVCTVRLQTKTLGNFTLLVTYDMQFAYEGADISVGGIETIDTESEVGYIVLASSASLRLEAKTLMPSIIQIDRDEIPKAYSTPVADPIIGAYKFVRTPHTAAIRVTPFDTEQMLGQVSDCITIETSLTKNWESRTVATYYVKNASKQYLVVQLPEGVKPWSIKLLSENGAKQDVLSQQSNGKILIPVRRPHDPNAPIAVEIVYAQRHGDMSFWQSALKGVVFEFPVLPETHATFLNWHVDVSEDQAIGGGAGDLTTQNEPAFWGFQGLGRKLELLWLAVKDGPGRRTLKQAVTTGWGGTRTMVFTRTVNLSGRSEPLALRLRVVPSWLGGVKSLVVMLVGIVAGMLLLVVGCIGRRAFLVALGLTASLYGLAQGAAGCTVLAILTVVLVIAVVGASGLWLSWVVLRAGGRGVCRTATGARHACRTASAARARRREEAALLKLAEEPPPFEAEIVDEEIPEPMDEDAGPDESEPGDAEHKLDEGSGDEEPHGGEPEQDGAPPAADDSTEDKEEPQQDDTLPPADEEAGDDEPGQNLDSPDEGKGGFVRCGLLIPIAAAALAVQALVTTADEQAAAPPPIVADSVVVAIEGPGTSRDEEQSAAVTTTIEFSTEGAVTLPVVPTAGVLTDYVLESRYLDIVSGPEGYSLEVSRKGTYEVTLTYQVPVTEKDGHWSIGVPVPPNMKNRVTLQLPEGGLEVQSDSAVLFKQSENDDVTEAEAVFGPVETAEFTWHPRVRKTKLEEAVFFCEVNTFVALRSGVVDLTNLVRYQIAQGELKELKLQIPSGMSVTAVSATGLATWSFDPDTRLLDAILEKPVSGDLTLTVTTQIASEGMPYSASLAVPVVGDSRRQRGSLAIAAPETIQVRIEDVTGLNPMNIEDFSADTLKAATADAARRKTKLTVRRAFRYHEAEQVAASAHTEQVLPEIRVTETGSLSIADERIVLTTKLVLSIAKAGVFQADLTIPSDFDVETLTGKDVSHWDEIREDEANTADTNTTRGITVYFNRQVTDAAELNLVVARMEKGIEERIDVPRVSVKDARKHMGRLTIMGERGVRMMVDTHRGVDIKKASEEGIQQSGVLVFDILRPSWSIVLRTEVMAPLIKPEVLQWIDLAEGMLQCRSYVQYKIENAGVKSFKMQSPAKGITLSVTGHNIARVHEVDKEADVWQVDLHKKQENKFQMTVIYQIPYDPLEQKVTLHPLKMVETDPQRGYLVVTCAGRVQVQPTGDMKGLKIEDPRSIPSSFGAGDLSSAILCYRTLRPDHELDLSVVRHTSADVLPATINRVRMTSVLSGSGKLVTHASLEMSVGSHRFLNVALPNRDDTLWTALVNGKEVPVSRDDELLCVPLASQEGDAETLVDLVYAGSSAEGFLATKQKYRAPNFGLPLNDIEWRFFVTPGMLYYGFGGTMEQLDIEEKVEQFTAERYNKANKGMRDANIEKAKEILDIGEELKRTGQQKQAQQAFQQALNYSQGNAPLNEDARVQLRNLLKQQVKVGLVNRRDAVRYSRNKLDVSQMEQMRGFKDGNFTEEYAASVERRLSAKDNDALEIVADKIIDQQTAAAGVVTAINITMPEHGREVFFQRDTLVDAADELTVEFRTAGAKTVALLHGLGPASGVFAGLWIASAIVARAGRRRKSAVTDEEGTEEQE